MKVYHLVYGAVPSQYTHVAAHLIETILKKCKTQTAPKKLAPNQEITLMSEGELKIMIYIYWQLVTQDLIGWKDDVPRKMPKLLLAHCWNELRETTERLRCGEVKAKVT